ncbi:MAG: N-acetylmuramoyl-L-alanine amidase family protein [Campylobacter sp.]
MVKISRVLFAFLLFLSFALGESRIENFDTQFSKVSQDVKEQLHQDMKSLYVKSIINNDKNLIVEVLQRLMISSKALGFDSKAYENELNLYGIKLSQKPKITTTKTNLPVQKQTLKITKVTKNKDGLELKLNQDISKDEIKFFELNSKGVFRKVYDIKGVYVDVSTTLQGFLAEEIRITQFDPSTIRIVFVSKSSLNLELFTNDKKLIFTLNKKNEPIKQHQIQEQNVPKPQIQDHHKKVAVKKNSKIIMLDAGHGGKDVGAVGGEKIYEKNVVLAIALKTGEELKSRGYRVYYTRSNDKFINLRDRTSMANDKLADLFISIHANAAPNEAKAKLMHGVETFFLSPARSERSKNAVALENKSDIEEMNYFSQQTFLNFLNREKIIASNKLAIDVQREVLASVRKINKSTIDGGVREAPFWVLVGAIMPAVLLEVGYITHQDERKLINTPNYQHAIAKGLADGVDIYFANQK